MLANGLLSQGTFLVTGGAGFIGCAVSQVVAASAERYVVVDNLHSQVHSAALRPDRLHKAAELVVADITEASTWERLLEEVCPTVVIHLAAETGTGQSLVESTRHGMVNVVGTTQMLDALTRHGVRPNHVVLTSSRAVYGEGEWVRADGTNFYPGQRTHAQLAAGLWDFPGASPLASSASRTKPDPISIYGATKLTQEHVLGAWCRSNDVPLTVLRFQNVYGPGQSLTNSYTGIVVLFSQLAALGKSIPLYEDGKVTRDFVFVDDAAAAISAALQHPGRETITIDIGSGEGLTIRALAEEIARLHKAPSPTVTGMFRDGDVRHATCSVKLAWELLGWVPCWELSKGLRALQNWVMKEQGAN